MCHNHHHIFLKVPSHWFRKVRNLSSPRFILLNQVLGALQKRPTAFDCLTHSPVSWMANLSSQLWVNLNQSDAHAQITFLFLLRVYSSETWGWFTIASPTFSWFSEPGFLGLNIVYSCRNFPQIAILMDKMNRDTIIHVEIFPKYLF
jgi:hypothetical protein